MRVVHLCPSINHLLIARLSNTLLADGIESFILTGLQSTLLADLAGSARVVDVPGLLASKHCGVNEAIQRLDELRPDCIIFHEPNEGLLADAVLGRGVPTYAFIHSLLCPGAKLFRVDYSLCNRPMGLHCLRSWYYPRCGTSANPLIAVKNVSMARRRVVFLKSFRAILVASSYMKEHAASEGIEGQLHVIDCGYAVPSRVKLSMPRLPNILFVGRLVENKGVQCLLRAVKQLLVDHSVTIVGTGYYLHKLRQLSTELELANVNFVGWKSPAELDEFYSMASVVVVPSLLPEPLSVVVGEAASYGLPVVVSDRGGLPEWAALYSRVLVVDVTDPMAFASVIASSIADHAAQTLISTGTARRLSAVLGHT